MRGEGVNNLGIREGEKMGYSGSSLKNYVLIAKNNKELRSLSIWFLLIFL